jgi:cytochrome c oxidase subunit 4
MSAHSHEEISKHVRVYLFVFLALLIGTVVTVGLNYLHFDSVALTVTIALFVAVVKATLVACYFMHLISEKKMIYVILSFTAFFFAALLALTLFSYGDLPELTTTR